MIYALEYSPSQKAFHRQVLTDAVKTNMEHYQEQKYFDWIIIAVGTWEEMMALGEKLQEEI